MLEDNKKPELSEEELEKATGGHTNINLSGYGIRIDTQRSGYCKYCNANRNLIFVGTDKGWVDGSYQLDCNKWRCTECNNDNYYIIYDGVLI